MPTKNKERDDLQSYKVYFVDGSTETFHTPDKLIPALVKDGGDGYHPLVNAKDEWLINMDNVLYIENVTPVPTKPNK